MVEKHQALTGYRALHLSAPMGVYCGKPMADMGADVIKVEPPGPAPMRRVPRLTILDLEGQLIARGRTFENGHNVYSNSRGDLYAVDTANQRVQKFLKVS